MSDYVPPHTVAERFKKCLVTLQNTNITIAAFNKIIRYQDKTETATLMHDWLTPAGKLLLSVPPSAITYELFDGLPRITPNKHPRHDEYRVYVAIARGPDSQLALKTGSTSSFEHRAHYYVRDSIFPEDQSDYPEDISEVGPGGCRFLGRCRKWNAKPEMIPVARLSGKEAEGVLELLETLFIMELNTMHESTMYPQHVKLLQEKHKDDEPVQFFGANRALPTQQYIHPKGDNAKNAAKYVADCTCKRCGLVTRDRGQLAKHVKTPRGCELILRQAYAESGHYLRDPEGTAMRAAISGTDSVLTGCVEHVTDQNRKVGHCVRNLLRCTMYLGCKFEGWRMSVHAASHDKCPHCGLIFPALPRGVLKHTFRAHVEYCKLLDHSTTEIDTTIPLFATLDNIGVDIPERDTSAGGREQEQALYINLDDYPLYVEALAVLQGPRHDCTDAELAMVDDAKHSLEASEEVKPPKKQKKEVPPPDPKQRTLLGFFNSKK